MKWLTALLFLVAAATSAGAQIDDGPKVHAQLIAESATVAPGGTIAVAFEQIIRPGWHTYWLNPGDVGQPTTLNWSLPPGWKSGDLQWPYPKRLPVGPFLDYGYEGKAWILTHLSAPATAKPGDSVTLKAAANWLVCKEICIPEDAMLSLPVKIGPPTYEPALVRAFAAMRARLPVPSPWSMHYALGGTLDLFVAAKSLALAQPTDAQFFPFEPGIVKAPAAQKKGFVQSGLVLRMTPGKAIVRHGGVLEGVLVLTSRDGSIQALVVKAYPGPVPNAD